MHSSVGTGLLAYTVGSKLMDVRIMPEDNKGTLRVQESTNTVANSDIDPTNSQQSRPGRSPSFGVKEVNFQEFYQEGGSNLITRSGCREELGDNNECECAESATANTSSFSHQSIDCKSFWLNDMDREDSLAEVSQLETSENSESMWPGPLPGGVDPVESTNLKLRSGGEIRPDTTTPNHMKNDDSSIQYSGGSGTCTFQRKNKKSVRTIPVERDPEKVGKTLWTELEKSFTEPTPSSQVSSSQRGADWLWTLHRIGKLTLPPNPKDCNFDLVYSNCYTSCISIQMRGGWKLCNILFINHPGKVNGTFDLQAMFIWRQIIIRFLQSKCFLWHFLQGIALRFIWLGRNGKVFNQEIWRIVKLEITVWQYL